MLPYRIDIPYRRTPVTTFTLIALNVVVFLAQAQMSPETFQSLMTQPQAFKPWQWLTSAFMHADLAHLAGNMLFLWVYGRYVEERLGAARYLALYLALALAGSLAFVLTAKDAIPALGASGAISGIMGVVIAAAPRARVQVLWFWFMIGSVRLPVILVLGLWILDQLWLASFPNSGIAVSAHLGGFATGFLIAFLLRSRFLRSSGWWLGAREEDAYTDEERLNRLRSWAVTEAMRERYQQEYHKQTHKRDHHQHLSRKKDKPQSRNWASSRRPFYDRFDDE